MALRKRLFCDAKPTLLPCKTAAFRMQNNRFCNVLITRGLSDRYYYEEYLQFYARYSSINDNSFELFKWIKRKGYSFSWQHIPFLLYLHWRYLNTQKYVRRNEIYLSKIDELLYDDMWRMLHWRKSDYAIAQPFRLPKAPYTIYMR